MESTNPPSFYRPIAPRSCRRAKWHDYRSRRIYMITINKASGVPHFSQICGTLGSESDKPRAVLSPLGKMISAKITALSWEFPFARIMRRIIMPEHVHFVIFITESTNTHLGEIITHLKKECTLAYNSMLHGSPSAAAEAEAHNAGDVEPQPLFELQYHDRILIKKDQLQRILDYVTDNPRRRLERMQNPDLHSRYMLHDEDGICYEAYGNIQLLEDPDIEAVKISRKYSPEELQKKKYCWMRTVENGGILVSPFISQAEKRVRDWAIENDGRIILIISNGFGKNYAPKEPLHTLCTEGRLLIIAPTEHSFSKESLSREECLKLNALAEQVAAYKLKR